MNRLKVGIAGYGVVGKRRRICVDKNINLKLVAVCDHSFIEDGVLSDGVNFYSNFRTMLSKMDLDILIVALTNDIAPAVTIEAIQMGINVFCEKPPGRSVEDLLEVIQAEKLQPDIKLMYGFNHRFHESVKDARKIIQSDQLGKVLNMRGVYGKSKLVTFNQSDWRTNREIAGGGVLLDQGIHMVDLMRLFGGEFVEIQSYISNSYWGYHVEDNAYALMRTDNGIVAMLHSSATQWRHRFNLEINLERGSLILGGILSGTKSYGSETLTITTVDHAIDNGDPKEQITRYNYDPSWEDEINLFTEIVMFNRPVSSGASYDALNTMKLVYGIYYADPIWRETYSINDPKIIS